MAKTKKVVDDMSIKYTVMYSDRKGIRWMVEIDGKDSLFYQEEGTNFMYIGCLGKEQFDSEVILTRKIPQMIEERHKAFIQKFNEGSV